MFPCNLPMRSKSHSMCAYIIPMSTQCVKATPNNFLLRQWHSLNPHVRGTFRVSFTCFLDLLVHRNPHLFVISLLFEQVFYILFFSIKKRAAFAHSFVLSFFNLFRMELPNGFEPMTSSLPWKRSTY